MVPTPNVRQLVGQHGVELVVAEAVEEGGWQQQYDPTPGGPEGW